MENIEISVYISIHKESYTLYWPKFRPTPPPPTSADVIDFLEKTIYNQMDYDSGLVHI